MPDVDNIWLGLRLGFFSATSDDEEEDELLLDDEEIPSVRVTFNEEDVLEYSEEDLAELSNAMADAAREHILQSLIFSVRQIRDAREVADVIDMYENQEPDWEV